MRKRYYHFNHRDSIHKVEPVSSAQLEKGKRARPKRSLVKFILLVLLLVFLVMISYVAYSSISAANNVLSDNIKISDIFNKSTLKQTDGVTNILLLGKGGDNHSGGQLTDTILLARVRQSDKKIALISIPRDLLVQIPHDGKAKINEAYANGWNDEKNKDKKADAGAKLASQTVESVVGVSIHYYVTVDFVGFKELVDELGGVTVYVDRDINDPYYPKDTVTANGGFQESTGYSPFYLKAGRQVLNGSTALKYARSRETTSDFDRAKRQQKLLLAIKEKTLSLGILANPVKLSEIINTLGSHIKTNMNIAEMKELVNLIKEADQNQVINKVIDNNPQDGLLVSENDGSYYLVPKAGSFIEVQKLVKNIFETTTVETAEIEVFNGSGVSGLANQFAQDLKEKGFNVTKIETNKDIVAKSVVYDGANNSSASSYIKSCLKGAEIKSGQEGIIKIILGKDYVGS